MSPSVRPFVRAALAFWASACTLNPPTTLSEPNRPERDAAAPLDAALDGAAPTIDAAGPKPQSDAGDVKPDDPSLTCDDGDTRPCGPSTEAGICRLGERLCEEGVWGACVGAVYPGPRDCASEIDNDCDGQPDNLASGPCECVPATTEPCDAHPGLDGSGPCRAGERRCEPSADRLSSSWSECIGSVGPAAEDSCLVSGDDSNCNGTPNDGCPCVENEVRRCGPTTDRGICAYGTSTCIDGRLTPCSGAVFPRERDCGSSLDNDCDGRPDDTLDAECTCALGTEVVCDTHPGLDGVGLCRAGARRCEFGSTTETSQLGACIGSVAPEARRCDSPQDHDCDGEADDTLDGECTCRLGTVEVCGAPPVGQSEPPCRAGARVCEPLEGGARSEFTACQGAVAPAPRDSCLVVGDDATCDGVVNGGCECVTARGNADCRDNPAASVCLAPGVCAPCRTAADCALVTGRNACSAGVCVQCTATSTAACAAGQVCENQRCVTPPPPVEVVELCEACTSDAECGASARCVAQPLGTGAFCFPLATAGVCEMPPYGTAIPIAAGSSVAVCVPAATTCQALADFALTACPVTAGVGDGTACGLAGIDDGVCVPDPAPATGGRCSVPCPEGNIDCPSGTCVQGVCSLAAAAL